jgi:hypothetical protein
MTAAIMHLLSDEETWYILFYGTSIQKVKQERKSQKRNLNLVNYKPPSTQERGRLTTKNKTKIAGG